MNFNLTGNRGSARPSFASVGAAKQYGSPPEDVCATVYLNQIVHVDLPFNTARASAIRQYCGSFLVDDRGRRLLIFRKETNGWTNIHHDSTAGQPKLTIDPVSFCEKLVSCLGSCPDVGRVKLYDESGAHIDVETVRLMPFAPLEGSDVAPLPGGTIGDTPVVDLTSGGYRGQSVGEVRGGYQASNGGNRLERDERTVSGNCGGNESCAMEREGEEGGSLGKLMEMMKKQLDEQVEVLKHHVCMLAAEVKSVKDEAKEKKGGSTSCEVGLKNSTVVCSSPEMPSIEDRVCSAEQANMDKEVKKEVLTPKTDSRSRKRKATSVASPQATTV